MVYTFAIEHYHTGDVQTVGSYQEWMQCEVSEGVSLIGNFRNAEALYLSPITFQFIVSFKRTGA